jgi:N-acetylneuraminic acid mutarotase
MQILQQKIVPAILMLTIASLGAQQWSYKAPMPTARKGMAAAVLQDKIWVIGGSTHMHQQLNTVEVFDPAANQWNSQAPNINIAREDATAQTWNGKIFVFGGFANSQTVSQVEIYDPAVGSWQTVTNMPAPRRGMASLVQDSTIWLIGGASASGSAYDVVDIYHPGSNSWETLPAHLNTARGDAMAAQIEGENYVFGGHFFGPISSYEKYNSATQSWQEVGNMPYHCGSAGYAVGANRAWIMGGTGQNGTLDNLQIFRMSGGNPEWLEGPPLNTPRRELVSAIIQNKIYAIGGMGHMGSSFLDVVEELSLAVPVVEQKEKPVEDYFLLTNYPNPFNGATTISIQLPEGDQIRVTLCDALGRTIAKLYQGKMAAGDHTLWFSSENLAGIDLPSGLYFLRLNGYKYSGVHKIFLVK